MRKITVLILMALCSAIVSAQVPIKNSTRVFSDVYRAQWDEIVKELDLNEHQAEELKPIYSAYVLELWNIDTRNKMPAPNYILKGDTLTDKEAYDAVMRDFDRAQKMLNIKKKYFTRFQDVLPINKIHKMYSVERHVRGRIINEMERRKCRHTLPNIK